jgi:hypothetical protein
MQTMTARSEDIMTDFQFKAILEMVKSIVRELHDEEKIIERIEQIKRGESSENSGRQD